MLQNDFDCVAKTVNTNNSHAIIFFGGYRKNVQLTMLRNGVNLYSLQALMGHADLQILKRYLKLTQQDTMQAHLKGSPVDKLLSR